MTDNTDFQQTWTDFHNMLHSDIKEDETFPVLLPHLAHYTTLANLENILRSGELWLSNPLHMNDLEEVRFVVNSGIDIVKSHPALEQAMGTDERQAAFYHWFDKAYEDYASDHVLDLYAICFSKHEPSDEDGRLSMWRGYGNNGKGAAIVIDTSKVPFFDDSMFALAPVEYDSSQRRQEMLKDKVEEVAKFLEEYEIPTAYLRAVAEALFRRICLFAVFSKHSGFSEEQEWRLVYLKERDAGNAMEPYFGYLNGSDGIHPKLKMSAEAMKFAAGAPLELSQLVSSIIIGPTNSSALTRRSVERMLKQVGKGHLADRLRMSSIPFRG